MENQFKCRVYGCAIIKSINSNYNADFSGLPRTLPNGTIYATDKALKWTIRNYWKNFLSKDIFFSKSLDMDMNPRTLDENYIFLVGEKIKNRKTTLKNLLGFIDIKLFGATFTSKSKGDKQDDSDQNQTDQNSKDSKNIISILGSCQISHGIDRYGKKEFYVEQIMSPFKSSGKKSEDSTMTTLGSQTRLAEGHYIHHFTLNPKNIENDCTLVDANPLTNEEINLLKEGLRKGVTYYDSASKIGSENECLFWVELKENSKLLLPSFIELIQINEDRTIDFSKIKELLKNYQNEINKIEIFYNKLISKIIHLPENTIENEL